MISMDSYKRELDLVDNRSPFDIPVDIFLKNGTMFPCSLIAHESDKYLTVAVTGNDARERIKILNKEMIESVEIVYREEKDKEKNQKDFKEII